MSTYKMQAYCNNCGFSGQIDIPKGIKVSDHQKEATCDNCGVKGDVKIESYAEKLTRDLYRKYPNKTTPPIYPWYPQPLPIPYKDYSGTQITWDNPLSDSCSTPENLRDCKTYNSLDK